MTAQEHQQDEHAEIRDAVAKLCAQFPGEYWRKLDREMAYPKAFVDALWNMPVPSGEQRYYDGLLYLMSLMHCSGNFRIIQPR